MREVAVFAHELPAKVDALRGTLEPWLAQHGVEVPHSFEELRRLVSPAGQGEDGELAPGEVASRAAPVLQAIGRWIWGGTSSALAVVGTLLVVPVFAFYLLHDFDRMIVGIRDLVPWRYRPLVVEVAREVDQVLGQFVRGQLLVMIILAVLYSVAYSIVGVRLAIPIGIVAGLLSFIPYVGGASALVLALAMCALGWQGWWQVVGVGISYGIIQVLEGFVITPRIVGDKVGLPAVWVLVALVLAGEIFGFLGCCSPCRWRPSRRSS
ncbi:MAG: AI-2E family transporter [Sandaracinaceae bacterium]|nr:AI-2E family transporter [Sandaracinaceae bacterium]